MESFMQYAVYLIILVVLAVPLGAYIGRVMDGGKVILSPICGPCERLIYKILRIDSREEMSAKKYIMSAVIFNAIGFLVLFFMLLLQGILPLNPGASRNSCTWPSTRQSAFDNTNWQAYSGESAELFSQMMGLTVQNFVSAATGIAVLFAVIRGFVRVKQNGIGNFWADLTRAVVYILLPLAVVGSILISSQGAVQSLRPYDKAELREPVALDENGEIIEGAHVDKETGAVTVDGVPVEASRIVTEQVIPLGPAAEATSIKQLGTNGGGFFGLNSTHPFENPTIFSNLIEMLYLLLIPVALCFTFGRNVKDKRQGYAIFAAMFILLTAALAVCAVNEHNGTPQLAQDGARGCGQYRMGQPAEIWKGRKHASALPHP